MRQCSHTTVKDIFSNLNFLFSNIVFTLTSYNLKNFVRIRIARRLSTIGLKPVTTVLGVLSTMNVTSTSLSHRFPDFKDCRISFPLILLPSDFISWIDTLFSSYCATYSKKVFSTRKSCIPGSKRVVQNSVCVFVSLVPIRAKAYLWVS